MKCSKVNAETASWFSISKKTSTGADPGFCNGGWGGGPGGARCMLNHLWCAVGPLHSQNILNFGWFDFAYWGFTPQQQPGSYQGGEMMMMKSVFWWRKPEYPEETTDLRHFFGVGGGD